jgi:hypothetical protein
MLIDTDNGKFSDAEKFNVSYGRGSHLDYKIKKEGNLHILIQRDIQLIINMVELVVQRV